MKKINADRIIALSAMLISLITLVIFLYQTSLMREQSVLSVRPRLTFRKHIDKTVTETVKEGDTTHITKIKIRIDVRNNGLGPAIIESSKVLDQGKDYELMTFFKEAYPKLLEYGFFSQITELIEGEAIPVSGNITLFMYEYDQENEAKIQEHLNTSTPYEFPFAISIIYSSMYEEKWQVDSKTEGHPKEVD